MKKLCSGWLITGIILMCGGCKSSFFDYNSTPGGSGKAESVTVEAYPAAVAPLKKSKIDPVEEVNIGYDYENAGIGSSLNETERQYYDEFRSDSERKKNKSFLTLF